jgi:hypothetical protein
MAERILCTYCKKEIFNDEKQVQLKTTKGDLLMECRDFHYECWLNDYNESLDKKVKSYAEKMMAFAKPAVEKAMESRGLFG